MSTYYLSVPHTEKGRDPVLKKCSQKHRYHVEGCPYCAVDYDSERIHELETELRDKVTKLEGTVLELETELGHKEETILGLEVEVRELEHDDL